MCATSANPLRVIISLSEIQILSIINRKKTRRFLTQVSLHKQVY